MPAKKYPVKLTAQEHGMLEQRVRRGKQAARKLTRARSLLKVAEGLGEEEIAEAVSSSLPTGERTRQRCTEVRLGALEERPRPGRKRGLDERGEARLSAEACSPAPEGRKPWTRQLLADRVGELRLAESCSEDTVPRVLKKTHSSRG